MITRRNWPLLSTPDVGGAFTVAIPPKFANTANETGLLGITVPASVSGGFPPYTYEWSFVVVTSDGFNVITIDGGSGANQGVACERFPPGGSAMVIVDLTVIATDSQGTTATDTAAQTFQYGGALP